MATKVKTPGELRQRVEKRQVTRKEHTCEPTTTRFQEGWLVGLKSSQGLLAALGASTP